MSVYFTADTHFNHANIIKYCGRGDGFRGFESAHEMNEWMTAVWNDTVKRESDEVWVLGDFAYSTGSAGEDIGAIFHRLRGRKHLVIGNHDDRNPKVLKLPWESQQYLHWYRDNGRRAHLCHYALESWRDAHRGALMLHGHSHGSLKRTMPHRFDVGIDVFKRPMDFEELWELGQKQSFQPADHHAGPKGEDL